MPLRRKRRKLSNSEHQLSVLNSQFSTLSSQLSVLNSSHPSHPSHLLLSFPSLASLVSLFKKTPTIYEQRNLERNYQTHHRSINRHLRHILRTVMRHIDLIVVHCSATRCNQHLPVTALIRCHQDRFGFTGYHYYITRNGQVYQTRHEQLVGAHARGYNQHSLGVCYEGGLDRHGRPADTRTACQKRALLRLLKQLKAEHPQATIVGHRDLPGVSKACPCFDATKEYRF